MTEEIRPIIIRKKIVKGGGGHHGGAWKVAYADFVTAMMAFFLMMWLLGATTEDQRKGISEYFNPAIPLAAISGGGTDALNGSSMFTEQTKAQNGTGEDDSKIHPTDSVDTPAAGPTTAEDVEAEMEALNAAMAEEFGDISDHMQIKMTPEGLVIELTDSDDDPLFAIGSTRPSPLLKNLINIVANSFNGVENNIKIVGHTDSRAYNGVGGYSNWELSTDRANIARRLLIDSKFPREQIAEVSGKADMEHLVEDGMAAQNRRISITIMN